MSINRRVFVGVLVLLFLLLVGLVTWFWIWPNFFDKSSLWDASDVDQLEPKPPIVELVDKASGNFEIAAQYREDDVEGRTIVYINRRSVDEKIARQFVFLEWDKIIGSEDRYIVLQLVSPDLVQNMKLRILFEGVDISPFDFQTELRKDDLNLPERDPEILNYFSDISEVDLNKFLQPGDVVNYGLQFNKGVDEIVYDENGIPVVKWLEIRRF